MKKNPPVNLSKEEMVSKISQDLNELKSYAEDLNCLVNDIQRFGSSDVSFLTAEKCKNVVQGLTASRDKVNRIRKILLLRIKTRTRELERNF